MKIVFDKRIPRLEELIKKSHPEIVVVAKEGYLINHADVWDADALIVRTRTRCDKSLGEGSALKLIASATIGLDHIDQEWCESQGIRVESAPGCNAPAVMQYVASSLHAAGFDPSHHILGVVGKGHIGTLVADLYRKSGTHVIVCDPPRADAGFDDEDYVSLEHLLCESDAVTFHVPYTSAGKYSTHHLLNGLLPDRLKFIINASRGHVINPAIIDDSRKFIIDTWPFEDSPAEFYTDKHKFLIDKAFIATPHIAGYSVEGKERATHKMIEVLNDVFSLKISTDGLADLHYTIPPLSQVISSFDPLPLSNALKRDPFSFEDLRNSHLRPEA